MTTTAYKKSPRLLPQWTAFRSGLNSLREAAPALARRFWDEQRQWLWMIVPFAVIACPVLSWASIPWRSDDYALVLQPLTPLFVAAFLWQHRIQIRDLYAELAFMYPADSPKRRGKLWPIFVGCVLMAIACVATAATFGPIALLIIAIGVFYYLYGPFMTRFLWLPLVLLLTMVPPPVSILQLLTRALQQGGAVVVGQVVRRLVPGTLGRNGVLMLPDYQMPLSPALSGVNVLIPALQLTLWYCVFRRIRAGQAVILLVASAALCSLLNVGRVSLIALIGESNNSVGDVLRGDAAGITGSALLVIVTSVLVYYLSRLLGTVRFHRVSEFEADLREATLAGGPTVFETVNAAAAAAGSKASAEASVAATDKEE